MENYILATDWELVEKDDFYLSDDWKEEDKDTKEKAKKLAGFERLYRAYICNPVSYCVSNQIDANEVYINNDFDIIIRCETTIINTNMQKCIEYNY